MNKSSSIPEFGERVQDQQCVSRRGSYALITDTQGRIAVMETPRGGLLPGGGSEGSETPEETLVREVAEECGFDVGMLRRIGEAVEYVYTPGNETGIRKECVFFAANVGTKQGAATEADHVLVWLEPQEAEARLVHESQRWAIGQPLFVIGQPLSAWLERCEREAAGWSEADGRWMQRRQEWRRRVSWKPSP